MNNSRNYKMFLKSIDQMKRCCYIHVVFLKLPSGANQKEKEKDVGAGNILKNNKTRDLP